MCVLFNIGVCLGQPEPSTCRCGRVGYPPAHADDRAYPHRRFHCRQHRDSHAHIHADRRSNAHQHTTPHRIPRADAGPTVAALHANSPANTDARTTGHTHSDLRERIYASEHSHADYNPSSHAHPHEHGDANPNTDADADINTDPIGIRPAY